MTGPSARTESDMGLVLSYGRCCIAPIVVALDQAKNKTNGEAAQRKSEYVHFVIGCAGDEKQADQAEHRHHQPDDEITHTTLHSAPLLR
jgi:hypothetical protein